MRARGKLTTAITIAAVLAPAAAWAEKRIEAQPSNRYSTPEITIDQGETVVFHNGDVSTHDVTADQKGPDGKPVFQSKLTDQNKDSPVTGADELKTGSYGFFCSVHPQMRGTIKVTANGTPKGGAPAPPPSGGGTITAAPADPNDKQAPTLSVKVLSSSVRTTRSAGVLKVSVKVDEAATVSLRAVARPKVGGPLVTVATGRITLTAAGRKTVSALLTRAGRRALRSKRKLAVVVTAKAVDTAGNASEEAAHGRTLGVKTKRRR
jgi:plastocyanin